MPGDLIPAHLPELIRRSWLRCREAGLSANLRVPRGQGAHAAGIAASVLATVARPVLESLARLLSGVSVLVLLADAQGEIVACLGAEAALAEAAELGLLLGSKWSEGDVGSNAIGICIAEGVTVELGGAGHFLVQNRSLHCVAAPVLGAEDRIAGALAIAVLRPLDLTWAKALVEMYRCLVEDRLIESRADAAVTLRLQSAAELLGSPLDGLAAFSSDGRLVARNRAARELMPEQCRVGTMSRDALGVDWGDLLSRAREAGARPLEFPLHPRGTGYARVDLSRLIDSERRAQGQQADGERRLQDLRSDDPRMMEATRRAKRILDRDITLLVQGETGSGKEWFARAYHFSGSRCRGPFVAVNCAAIPAGLIEAELFGYVDGAFTGARRSGSLGKIREAHRGTLFLDEIGDMPLPLQAVLLRVLETRSVLPLGAECEELVDIALVCASHQPLHTLVSRGQFRADLFFRISGMTVSLPPLRERSDFEAVVRQVLKEESGGRAMQISPDALRLLRAYAWPGNLRQLRNVLRLSVALMDETMIVDLPQLPAEIRQRARERSSQGADLRAVQARLVRESVARHGGNISAAARELGITRTTLYRKLSSLSGDPNTGIAG